MIKFVCFVLFFQLKLNKLQKQGKCTRSQKVKEKRKYAADNSRRKMREQKKNRVFSLHAAIMHEMVRNNDVLANSQFIQFFIFLSVFDSFVFWFPQIFLIHCKNH